MTLSYGPNTVVLKADSRKAVTNGVKSQMGAPVVHGNVYFLPAEEDGLFH
mgnify:CR=1 FL=1